eukprot:TRINITY_DN3413_c0_g2_i5.p1 TRINITY_DN3413_c0_g2~~TRINITY_DN3413_c0_g2_i5.p1  ORF type:complete len:105 (-),score=15.72 TRINITY_DN3413_c0_g2_i5:661-975(-)
MQEDSPFSCDCVAPPEKKGDSRFRCFATSQNYLQQSSFVAIQRSPFDFSLHSGEEEEARNLLVEARFSVLLPMTSSMMVDHSLCPILWFYHCSHWVQLVPLLVS